VNFNNLILTILIAIPALGAVIVSIPGIVKGNAIRVFTLGVAIVDFVVGLPLIFLFDSRAQTAGVNQSWQFEANTPWIKAFGINYHVGIDGVGLLLVQLTTLLSIIAVLAGWSSIQTRLREYHVVLLLLQVGTLGVFTSLDLFLFYIYFELVLIPMALLIGIWGSQNRVYAAVKFFLYTLVGSVLMLVAIIALYIASAGANGGVATTDLPTLTRIMQGVVSGQNGGLGGALGTTFQNLIFLGFAGAFAIKVPLWPLHTWLPDAHVQAPTAGSVILAGTLLKLGGYGFLRFAIPLAPIGAATFQGLMIALSLIAIIYGALVSLVQPDLKKLVAYSSVSHMGFVVLGLFTFTQQGIDGAVLQMVSHGLLTGGLFFCVGVVYERLHTRDIAAMGGMAYRMPIYAAMFGVLMLGSLGLPGISGFLGEFLVFLGAFNYAPFVAAIASIVIIIAPFYLMWMFQRAVFSKPKASSEGFPDLRLHEAMGIITLVVLAIGMGVYPLPLFQSIAQPDANLMLASQQAATALVNSHEQIPVLGWLMQVVGR